MNFSNIISPEIKKSLRKLSEVFDRLKREYPDEMNMMFKDHDQLFATYGWYIYDGTSLEDVLFILKLLNNEKIDKAEELIQDIFETNLDDIETDLLRFDSESHQIIKEAIYCHKKNLFYASTILFLSLSDGLVNGKLFTKSFFQKIRKHNKEHFLLDIFNERNLVNKTFQRSKSPGSELMRHGIMHGHSKRYGNKVNSLKALSLFHFISLRENELTK